MEQPEVKIVTRLTNGDHFWHCLYSFRRVLWRRLLICAALFFGFYCYFNYEGLSDLADFKTWIFLLCGLVALIILTFIIDFAFYFGALQVKKIKHKDILDQQSEIDFFSEAVHFETPLVKGEMKYDVFEKIYLYKRHAILKSGQCHYIAPYRDVVEGTKEDLINLLSKVKEKRA